MTMHGGAAIFCGESALCRMLEALLGEHPPRIAVADGDDPAAAAEAQRYCREQAVPLILITRHPSGTLPPPDIAGRVLGRPFLFTEFRETLRALTDCAPQAEQEADTPLLLWDSTRRAVICGGKEVLLTPREADVFARLYAAAPAPVSRELLQQGFARTAGNGADVYISYLRRKLAALPLSVRIHSVRGSGYALLVQPSAAGESGNTDQLSGDMA